MDAPRRSKDISADRVQGLTCTDASPSIFSICEVQRRRRLHGFRSQQGEVVIEHQIVRSGARKRRADTVRRDLPAVVKRRRRMAILEVDKIVLRKDVYLDVISQPACGREVPVH